MMKSAAAKIILIAVLVVAAAAAAIMLFPRPVIAPEPEETPSLSPSPTEAATPSPSPSPSPTIREAYIPDPEELQPIPEVSSLTLTEDYLTTALDAEKLAVSWPPAEGADYYVICVLDADNKVLQQDILYGDISSWEIPDFKGTAVLMIFYKDMGEDSAADDTIVLACMQEIEPLPTATPTKGASTKTQNKYYIIVDKADHAFSIFTYDEKGEYTIKVKTFPCALGKSGKQTPTGTYKVGKKGSWKTWTGYNPDRYSPYYTYYTYAHGQGLYIHGPLYSAKKRDKLIRDSYEAIGTNASSGCVRTTVAGAYWVYKYCPSGTVVKIVDSSDLVSWPGLKAIDEAMPNWDPTDPEKPEAPPEATEPTDTPTETPTEAPTETPTESTGTDVG